MALKLWSDSFTDGAPIPGEFAFCVIDPKTHVAMSSNRNPHLAWSDAPGGTKSFALISHDYDVPSRGDDVNQEGRLVPPELPRVDFFHWVLIDIPATMNAIAAGSHSNSVTPRGKSGPAVAVAAPGGMRHGINDYTGWFAGDKDMAGDYFGYDGPCPPWNDSLVHHYVFSLFALDVARLPLEGKFTGAQARQAMQRHVLSHYELMGTYTLNPALV
jgi:Raf kinase inhibitor-like YbhB/YbcL family protein